jgi:multidrug efflux system membrane fusion protein
MTIETERTRRIAGQFLSGAIILYAVISGLVVFGETNLHPRTDDAEVFANFIGIAPQVDGPIMKLYVRDNQFVKKGGLLAEIDERPYAYALQQAESEQEVLEGKIIDERRSIAAQTSGISVAQAGLRSSEANVAKTASAIEEARADEANAQAGLARAQNELAYARDNLHRIEPLLGEQFVTVDQVDQARTLEVSREQAVEQGRAQLKLAQASLQAAIAQNNQAKAALDQTHQQVVQAGHSVMTLDPLVAARSGRSSAIFTAQYNLNNCRIYAPFDAIVTNLTISEGEYAHTGQQMFTLIDTRTWWVIGNFRETQLRHIRPGMHADVYLLSEPNRRISGTVDSVGFGVTPDPDVIGRLSQGLPDVQRTLDWVHLASRFPVRVLINSVQPDLLRMGESAVVVLRGVRRPGDR